MKRASMLTFSLLALAVSSGCTQAPAPCQIQTGEYIIRFTPTATTPATCRPQFGDVWAFQPFLDVNKRVLIAGFSETITGPPDPETDPNYQTSPLYFKGNFTSDDPDAADLCTIASGSVSDGTTTIAMTEINWLSTAVYLGTQFEANVTFTDATCPGGAYTAHAINPPVFCGANADCDPFAQPVSSGINSKYNQSCTFDTWATDLSGDPDTGVCFFNEDFPSLGSFTP